MQRQHKTIRISVRQLKEFIQEEIKIHLKDYLKLYSEEVIIDELILFNDNEDDSLPNQL